MIEIVARVQEIYPWSEVSRTFCQVKMDERWFQDFSGRYQEDIIRMKC
jgi:hypothetical protein